jgi:hypothetical protein
MLGLFLLLSSALGAESAATWETDTFRYTLSADATSMEFVDLAEGQNYCDVAKATTFALWSDGEARPATQAHRKGKLLTLQFGGPDREADFRVTTHPQRIEFALTALRDAAGTLQELQFGAIPLTLAGLPSERFAVSPLALNLETYVAEIPGYSASISGAKAFKKLGILGAGFAVVACPSGDLRNALKEAVAESKALPKSDNGGPWALDAPINQQSYFLDVSGKVNEQTVDSWIAMLNGLGVKQLDLHGGYAFRWGDYAPNPREYPNGRDSLKAVVDKLHEAGIAAGLHTYAMFIAKDTPWVTPVPDPGLAKSRTLTLAADITADAPALDVLESTEGMTALTGFHHRNSATLQIDDELIVYTGVSQQPPYRFTECTRGAYGTVATAHAKDAKVHHLKECFGLFAPDPDSELWNKVIVETAKTYNYCGFDMMYMDALDGSDVVDLKGGGELAWYYGAKFTYELVAQLEKSPLLEMSTFGHHLWAVRSRMGAWDACQRAPQTFADIHMLSNGEWQKRFLPTNLGWWGIFPWSGVQPKRSLADDVAYICTKAIATNSSLSLLLGFSPDTYPTSYQQQRFGDIIRQHEALRLSGTVPAGIREQLATPGQAFRLEADALFVPVDSARHDLATSDGRDTWQVQNAYAAQEPRITVEHLLSVEALDSENAELIDDFSDVAGYGEIKTNTGVTGSFSVVEEPVKDAKGSAMLRATNQGASPNRAWATVERTFDPPLNLKGRGMGLWVHGDGSGAVLNIQIQSPKHTTFALTEHYIDLDFTGWRYIEVIETEDYAIEEYEWPYSFPREDWQGNLASAMGFAYPLYHAHLDYAQIGALRLALNGIPVGREVATYLGPIHSLPHKPSSLKNPKLVLNGHEVAFPVTLESGHMLEFTPPSTYTVCDAKGELVERGEINTPCPQLEPGANSAGFSCQPLATGSLHTRITLTTAGPPLKE